MNRKTKKAKCVWNSKFNIGGKKGKKKKEKEKQTKGNLSLKLSRERIKRPTEHTGGTESEEREKGKETN